VEWVVAVVFLALAVLFGVLVRRERRRLNFDWGSSHA